MKFLTPFNLATGAVAIAVIAFFFARAPAIGILVTMQYGNIWLTDRCSGGFTVVPGEEWCGIDLPYKWLLAVCIAALAAAAIWHRGRISN